MSKEGNAKPSVVIQTMGEDSPRISELQEQMFSGGNRPASLQKNPQGGSARLTVLGDMIRSYSVAESVRQSLHMSPSAALEEIDHFQWLLNNRMPGITNAAMSSRRTESRKTMLQLQAHLEMASDDQKGRDRLHALIRDMSLKKLETDTFTKLHIIYNNQIGLIKDNHEYMPPFSPFAWTVEDFIARRHVRNTVWLDMLLCRSEKDLEMMKFKSDLEELFQLLSLLFQGLMTANDEVRQNLFTYVHDAYEFLKFPQALKINAKQNMEKLREQVNTYLDMLKFKRGAGEEAYKVSLEQKLMDLAVLGPIELRYEVNWMQTKTEQAIMKMTRALEDIENKANEYRKEESKETYCARCVLDMYYVDIDKYKIRIAELSAQYENELEKAENEIAYKKISMDKLRDQRKFLEDQIIRFHDEIEQLHQKEREEILAEQKRKQEEELRALEEATAKQKKGKAKDKKKK